MALAERLPFQGGSVGATRIGGAREGIDAVLDLLARSRPSWHALAACRGRSDLSWFPGAGDDSDSAVAVCGGCSVAAECRQAAEENDEVAGIWAGLERGRRPRDSSGGATLADVSCGACGRDGFRIRDGYCGTCRRAWFRAGRPEDEARQAFDQTQRQRLALG